MALTPQQRREIVAREIRKALSELTPNVIGLGGDAAYSGQQLAYAKGKGRKRALSIIDAQS